MPVKRAKSARPLWTCPECGQKFVTRNLWHSCGLTTVADWKKRMTPKVLALYDRFESMIASCGEYYAAPAKTRIAFMGRIRFAGVTKIDSESLTCNFALSRPLASKRFAKVEEIVPGWWVHRMRITDLDQLDDQVQRWIARAYRTIGTHGLRKRTPGRRQARR
jgi:hypothetical protein